MAPRKKTEQDISALLAEMPLFANLGQVALLQLAEAAKLTHLAGQRLVYATGSPAHVIYLLVDGAVKRGVALTDEAERILELVRPGQCFPLSEAFGGKTYRSFAVTLTGSTVIAVPVGKLLQIAEKNPPLGLRLVETLGRNLFNAEFEMISHHALSGAQRVLDYLLHLAGDQRDIAGETTVRLDASKKLIAARLDMTPETFSRTLRQLSTDGVIVVNGRSIHIQNATLALDGINAAEGKPSQARYPRMERKQAEKLPSPAALVNLCGRHRMLSQRLAATWCIIACGLAPDSGRVTLRQLRGQFDRNIDQVAGLPLPAQVAKLIVGLRKYWERYRTLLELEPIQAGRAQKVFELSEQVLAIADKLTSASASAAGTPAATFVNISGRNRMLSARMTKLFLMRDVDELSSRVSTLMEECRKEFDANMRQLRERGSNVPEIIAQLNIDEEHWLSFLAAIDASSHAPTQSVLKQKALESSEALLRHVDTTVKLYEKLAEKELSHTQHNRRKQ